MRASLLLSLLLVACSGDTDGTGNDTDRSEKEGTEREVTITMAQPSDGAEFDEGDAIPLKVTAKKGSKATDIDSATWTIGGWTGDGVETQATGLPAGAHTVTVEAVVDGETFTASADITVTEPPIYNYAGTLDAQVVVQTDDYGDFDDRCSTPISFTLDAGVITGSATCAVFDDFDLDPIQFAMEGTVRGGVINGALVMSADGSEYRTPFDGTGTAGDPLTASFDKTHANADGSIRIVGSWSATPQ